MNNKKLTEEEKLKVLSDALSTDKGRKLLAFSLADTSHYTKWQKAKHWLRLKFVRPITKYRYDKQNKGD